MKKKSVSRKYGAKTARSPASKSRGPNLPKRPKFLDDNPKKRFLDVMADRQFGAPPVSLAKLRAGALAAARAMSPAGETNLTPATPGGSNWIELGPTGIPKGQTYGGARVIVTGRVTQIVQHPADGQTIYVGAARGGIWKSTDGGVTWFPKSDNEGSLAIGALAIAASNPQTLYAGTGEGNIYFYRLSYPLSSVNASYEGVGILKSTDGGNTWTLQGSMMFTGQCFFRIAVDPNDENIAFAASSLGLHRTTDGGASWVLQANGLPAIGGSVIACCDIVIHPTDPDTAYCAFWGDGIYKTTNATAMNPSWTKLAGGLPATSLSRFALAISPTAPSNVFALIANSGDTLKGFYVSADDGATWSSVAAAVGVVQVYGAFTLHVFVDVSTPDIVYLSGVEVYKAVKNMGAWSVTNVGGKIHPDNHAFAGHPADHLKIYAGNDGGIYKSSDGGATWDDLINEGINITQFEFIGQHPTSDAIVIGGTQDNGTEMFRNHPAFYHSADGDGGASGIDAADPKNVIHTYYGASPERSTQGGKFGTYASVAGGLAGGSLFYPPFAYDETNPQNIAFGTNQINLDANQGTGGWPTKVGLPGITGRVSAIHYVNPNLIYVGTSAGEVYRLVRSAGVWTATAIHTMPLPSLWIWDVSALPGNPNSIVVVMAGFGNRHAWRGTQGMGNAFTWVDVSGTMPNQLPDVPVNSLCIDPLNSTHYYVGTDIGVFRSTDAGVSWQQFSDGLPNTAVYDLRLHESTRLLRAATHGRGLWERRLDALASSNVDLYVRDHPMSTSRILPAPSPVKAPIEDPLQNVSLGDNLWWWQCADVKVDSPAAGTHNYQMPIVDVDYFAFETKLAHRSTQRGATNRVYVQIHNRGIQAASNVTVKILYADASPGLPNLPPDFWTSFPGNGTTTIWKPIGTAKVISSLSPKRPEILEWDWVPPLAAASHSCLLIVVDCSDDPIPAINKVFDIATLVSREKRVGLKNLHVIDALPAPFWFDLKIYGKARGRDLLRLGGLPPGWSVGVLMPQNISDAAEMQGFRKVALTAAQLKELDRFLLRRTDVTGRRGFGKSLYVIAAPARGAVIQKFPPLEKGFPLLFLCQRSTAAKSGAFDVLQMVGEKVVGGNTFILRPIRGG